MIGPNTHPGRVPGLLPPGDAEAAVEARVPGLTARSVLDKMAAIQMVDVQLPTTDGRTAILSRYTEPERDQALLLQRLKINLPTNRRPASYVRHSDSIITVHSVVPTLRRHAPGNPTV